MGGASLLLCAITTPPTAEPAARVVRVDVGQLVAWAAHPANEHLTREDMLAHHTLVGEVFAHVEACLPARFPTRVEEAQLRQQLQEQQSELADRLEAVRGA